MNRPTELAKKWSDRMSGKEKLKDGVLDEVAGGAITEGGVALMSLGTMARADGEVGLGFLNPSTGSGYGVMIPEEEKDKFMEMIASKDFSVDELKELGYKISPLKERSF